MEKQWVVSVLIHEASSSNFASEVLPFGSVNIYLPARILESGKKHSRGSAVRECQEFNIVWEAGKPRRDKAGRKIELFIPQGQGPLFQHREIRILTL